MNYEIKGGSFPIVECTLDNGEKIVAESGSMCWMDSTFNMETSSNGGIGKVIGRLVTNESLFQNIYTSTQNGSKISFGTTVPGAIFPIQIKEGQCVICQKSAFLASYGDVESSVFFNKKIGVGIFGGEGFIMQKLTGNGIAFIEIDGSGLQYDLQPGQKLVISSGFLVSMSETCTIDIQTVKGVKNLLFGGEGLFNTVVTRPGRVIVQTMPLARLAEGIVPFIPKNPPSSK